MLLINHRLADFEGSETVGFGVLRGHEVVRLDAAMGHDRTGLGSMRDYLAGLPGTYARAELIRDDPKAHGVPLEQVHPLPAVRPDVVLMCDGLAGQRVVPQVISGTGHVVAEYYQNPSRYSINPQLGVVIGASNEGNGLGGFVIFNEIHVREIDSGLDRVGVGIGPYLATPDEIGDPLALGVRVEFDRRAPWQGTTAYHYPPAEVVAALRMSHELLPGTLVGLGPIPGGFCRESDRWLEKGERYTVSIDGLGSLTQYCGERAAR